LKRPLGGYYSEEGRPAKPVRLMVGMLLLKQMYDQSDEDVVERWVENPYWQQFCGMSDFQWQLPCDPSDLVYFRQRIGEQGVALILAISVQMHGERAKESEVVVDSTVQENVSSHVSPPRPFAGEAFPRCDNFKPLSMPTSLSTTKTPNPLLGPPPQILSSENSKTPFLKCTSLAGH